MNCSECGYIHRPYSVEDVQTEGFMEKFILHNNYLNRLGRESLEQCKKFYQMHKHRVNLEKIYSKKGKFTPKMQKAWDDLQITYPIERDKRTELLQKFIDICKHENLSIPEWIKQCNWLNT